MKTILITGSTDGIGLQTARELAGLGHEVILHGRNAEKVARARDAIERTVPEATLQTVHADLADLDAVADLARDLAARLPRLDVLINNAGVYMVERKLSRDGFEMTLAVNHLAHFLLTNLLLPLLRKSNAPRVVTVSSIAHSGGRIEFDNLNSERSFNGFHAYANSKLANALFARELARREPWLTSNSLHPGVIGTKLLRAGFSAQGAPVEAGARTPVYLATSLEVANVTGRYFVDCRAATPAEPVLDAGLAQELWAWSEHAVGVFLVGRTSTGTAYTHTE